MAKQSFWATRLGNEIQIEMPGCRMITPMHAHETALQTVYRMGFQVVGSFCFDQHTPGRSTAKVVRR